MTKMFIMAYDEKCKRRVPFVVINNIAKSVITNTTFEYKNNEWNNGRLNDE